MKALHVLRRLVPVVVIAAGAVALVSCGDDAPQEVTDAGQTDPDAGPITRDGGPIALRNALGDETDDATLEQVLEELAALDDDNIFLVMSDTEYTVQAMIGDDLYHVEYLDGTGHFHSVEYATAEETAEVFTLYYREDPSWYDVLEWVEWE